MQPLGRAWRARVAQICALLLCVLPAASSPAQDLLDPANGAVLTHVDAQHSATTWAGTHLTDGDVDSFWLSSRPTNDLVYKFDESASMSCFGGFSLENYGNARSIRSFTLLSTIDTGLSSDTGTEGWRPVPADPSPTGLINHVHWSQGGRLTAVDSEHNATNWAGRHLNDGSQRSLWLSRKNENTLEYAFDTDWDGSTGDAINLDEIRLYNYGNDRSVSKFQIHVTRNGTDWSRLAVPGTAAGDPDFNFLLEGEGARLTRIDRQHNTTSWAGHHLHDGDDNSIWLSNRANNELDFEFDTDFDGTTGLDGDSADLFAIERLHLRNHGGTRSVRLFQVEVRTNTTLGWSKLEVPGSTSGTPDFNFLLDWEGGTLTRIDAQHNATNWAASHLHDGDENSFWLSSRSNNELDFEFDTDGDGATGVTDPDDRFRIDELQLVNYGSARSVQLFQVEVKTRSNDDWTPLEVPGSAAGDPNFNFALVHEGASLTRVDAQHNATNWAGRNLHDGDLGSRWLSSKPTNELDFAFDTDADGSTGDAINFHTIRLYNYGGARSVRTFEVEVQTGGPAWTPVTAPGGGTTFTALQAAGAQDFSVGPLTGVTGVRLRTLTNYGDPYTGATEWELLGDSVRASHTFTAQPSSDGESFVLDAVDRPEDVKALRFRSIRNYGDSYTGARELRILGHSVGPSHTFEATQSSTGQDWVLDAEDRPSGVTSVRFRSIQNYGDSYTGVREFKVFGQATRHSYTFEPGRSVGPHVFTLDPEDRVDGVVGARFRSLNNYGDSYVGAKELELLGDPVGPSFVFAPSQASTLQSFTFGPTAAKLFRFRALDSYGDSYVGAREIGLQAVAGCTGLADHMVISHDGAGVQCIPEPIGVTVVNASGLPEASYDQTIVLDTQTGTGNWTSAPGNLGRFSDAAAGDGLATYTFATNDGGTADFFLNDVTGAQTIDVDVHQSDQIGIRDDDSEGNLLLAPSTFIMTASPLPDPPPDPINDPISVQTAGVAFDIHLAAYGTTTNDRNCGLIESYDGKKSVRFWVDHGDPSVAPLVPTIDTKPIASSEAGAVRQTVTFSQGRAVVRAKYKDVGRISLHALDDTVESEIRGATDGFVSRPADLVVVAVANAAGAPNPGADTPTGELFARAGESFVVDVEARDAEGSRTPSYGSESVPEGIRLRSSVLVAPANGRNGTLDDGAIANPTAFSATLPAGRFSGSTFVFDEVGAIRLEASVADGDYLGTGGLTGSESGIVGRFAPARFEITSNTPRFRTACGIGAFTWMGEPFEFVSGGEPRLSVRAVNLAGETTANYAGSWWRLTNASLANRSYAVGEGTLNESGLPDASTDPAIASNGDGTGTLTFSAGSGLVIARDTLRAPYDAEIQLSIDVLDEDGIAYAHNPYVVGGTGPGLGIDFDVSKRFQFGRLRFDNAHGSELVDLPMPLRTQRFDGSVFVDDDSDSCSQIPTSALTLAATPAGLSTSASIANNPLFAGDSGLVIGAPNTGGAVDIVVDLGPSGASLPWLRFDWPDDGNLDGIFDDDPRARATFGIWQGREHLIYTREVY